MSSPYYERDKPGLKENLDRLNYWNLTTVLLYTQTLEIIISANEMVLFCIMRSEESGRFAMT